MQTQTATAQTASARAATPAAVRYPTRDFGIGYGRSSGYASPRRYSQSSTPLRFRIV